MFPIVHCPLSIVLSSLLIFLNHLPYPSLVHLVSLQCLPLLAGRPIAPYCGPAVVAHDPSEDYAVQDLDSLLFRPSYYVASEGD